MASTTIKSLVSNDTGCKKAIFLISDLVWHTGIEEIMEIVVQRVKEAKVLVDGENVGSIGSGLLLLVGLSRSDSDLNPDQIEKIASKILN